MKKTPTLAAKELVRSYCCWAESQAKNNKDFLLLGLGPVFLVALVLWLLPTWLGTLGALIFAVPALYIVFIVLRVYAVRDSPAQFPRGNDQ
jgi:membrane protein implicated in regulation of membrane protease activity